MSAFGGPRPPSPRKGKGFAGARTSTTGTGDAAARRDQGITWWNCLFAHQPANRDADRLRLGSFFENPVPKDFRLGALLDLDFDLRRSIVRIVAGLVANRGGAVCRWWPETV